VAVSGIDDETYRLVIRENRKTMKKKAMQQESATNVDRLVYRMTFYPQSFAVFGDSHSRRLKPD